MYQLTDSNALGKLSGATEALIRTTFSSVPPAPALVALARFTYEPGSFFGPAAGPGPVVFHMVAGVLDFTAEGIVTFTPKQTGTAQDISPGTTFKVRSGDQLLVPGDTPHTALSTGSEMAVTLGLANFPAAPPQTFPPGISFYPLTMGMANTLPTGPVSVLLNRYTSHSGAGVSHRSYPGPGVQYIEAGTLGLTANRGEIRLTRPSAIPPGTNPLEASQAAPLGIEVTLTAGDGVFIQPGSEISWRNLGDTVVTFLDGMISPSDDGYPSTQRHKDMAEQYLYELWDTGNIALVDTLFAQNFVNHRPLTGQLPGRAGVKQLINRWRAAFPDFSVSADLLIAQRDIVVIRWTLRGTHRSVFLGIAATDRLVTISGITIFKVDGSRITESWEYWDQATMLEQMEVVQWPRGYSS